MNRIMTSLTLLAGIGLVTLAPQAQAGDHYRDRNAHHHSQHSQHSYGHGQRQAYRHGYREARHDVRGHRHARQYRQYRGHDHYPRHNHRDDGIRVIFRF